MHRKFVGQSKKMKIGRARQAMTESPRKCFNGLRRHSSIDSSTLSNRFGMPHVTLLTRQKQTNGPKTGYRLLLSRSGKRSTLNLIKATGVAPLS